jgi:regulator of sirC expression with transglutaminase-like and TPR domain
MRSQLAPSARVYQRSLRLLPSTPMEGRGLARALTRDHSGAIVDLEVYVEWTKDNGYYDPYGIEIEGFVAELEAGRNPFDEATLDKWR